ncbi:TetR/AcrR family transcriptional regulator [Nocardia uniformis]|uniref:TetR/AcrR family transcriptional regulator n=1 Tax=Nocardia uniformis TaxID=53432 RepID=A0A849CDG9_9NOCA|nr:TetR/AcrR family transcriptional regulator [Nocardia uniformis]
MVVVRACRRRAVCCSAQGEWGFGFDVSQFLRVADEVDTGDVGVVDAEGHDAIEFAVQAHGECGVAIGGGEFRGEGGADFLGAGDEVADYLLGAAIGTMTSDDPIRRGGREAQRRRTRKAILDATVQLSASGATPSIDEIAAAADVSRRTIYTYFPALDQLLIDATARALHEPPVEAALADPALADDPAGRVDALIRTLLAYSPQSLPLGRRMIRLTVDTPTSDTREPGNPIRGHRRVEWLEQACEPLRKTLSEAAFQRLISALTIVVGWEAQIALRDVRGLGPQAEEEAITWAARVLVEAAIEEHEASADVG